MGGKYYIEPFAKIIESLLLRGSQILKFFIFQHIEHCSAYPSAFHGLSKVFERHNLASGRINQDYRLLGISAIIGINIPLVSTVSGM